MVRSKEELVQCANAWVGHARNDIRNQIVNFLQMSNVSEELLADLLGISENELRSIIETNNDISLTTFAKLLIATDNVLEIKPLSESPLANGQNANIPHQPQMAQNENRYDMGHHTRHQNRGTVPPRDVRSMPNGGMMPPMGGIPVDNLGRPIDPRTGRPLPPPPAGYPMPNGGVMPPMGGEMPHRFGGMPGMNRRMGRFNPTQPQMNQPTEVGGEQPLNDLASKSRNELVQMICDNFWNGEINCEEVSKTELINFLNSKRQGITPQRPVVAPQPQMTQTPTVEPQIEGVAVPTEENATVDSSVQAFQKMLDDAVAQNPNLMDIIAQYRTE